MISILVVYESPLTEPYLQGTKVYIISTSIIEPINKKKGMLP